MKLLHFKLLMRHSPAEGAWNLERGALNLRCAVAALFLVAYNNGAAQIQQAWVAHYNNGIPNGTNQPVKMALDSIGNIYISGFSQNSNNQLGYATIKYAPNGTQLWADRYDSTNYPTAMPAGLVLDSSNNVVVTGSALTVKYDVNGNQLWTAPYAGTALAVDTDGNVGVTGFGTSFNTVKLSPTGTNLWIKTTSAPCGQAVGQAIIADTNRDFYVAGSYPFACEPGVVDYQLDIVKYGPNGNQIWTATYEAAGSPVAVAGISLAGNGNLYLASDFNNQPYTVLMYDVSGSLGWASYLYVSGLSIPHGIAIDKNSNVGLAGQIFTESFLFEYGTYELNANGTPIWTNDFPSAPSGSSVATSIVADSGNDFYVTGYSPGTNSANDIVTIKYDPKGKQTWLQRYTSPSNGNAAGNAIAVDNKGNVYVAGYDTTAAGGTEMVLIKYSPVTLQRKPDGTVLLETQGSPGESFDIEASIDLLNWLDLGTVLADTNGLMQFDDTNAPNFPSRFYYTNPQ
jgi:hypothetical protein